MTHGIASEILNSPLVGLFLVDANGPEPKWGLSAPGIATQVTSAFLVENKGFFDNPQKVVLFQDAKSTLRRLLALGVDVARPTCLQTLTKITSAQPRADLNPFEALDFLIDQVNSQNAKGLARLECLAVRSFAHMEHQGLYIDTDLWNQALADKRKQAEAATLACGDFLAPFADKDLFNNPVINLNNLEEMRALFEKVLGKKLSGLSHEVLEGIDHPLAKAYLQYREASKLISTYGDRFLEFVDPKTKRIHAEFELLAVSTGRTSCHKPNLQNLPSDAAFAKGITAPSGRALVHADFSACELRVLAGFANDPGFLAAINSDDDFHSAVASTLFNTEVTKTQNAHLRQKAKAVNFGIIYGMSAKGLALSLNVSDEEASQILSLYFAKYHGVRDFLEGCVSFAKHHGYARTLLGRRLYLNQGDDVDISRIAKNMPIQGTAAELAKLAMTRVHERLSHFDDAFLVNMIHDELVVECSSDDAQKVGQAVKEEMMGSQEALFPQVRPDVEISCEVF